MKVNCINNKFYSMLGICQRAGKLVSGHLMSEKYIKSGHAKLVIISEDASDNTKKRFKDLSTWRNIKYLIIGDSGTLGSNIGKEDRTVLVVIDNKFKDLLLNIINDTVNQHGGEEKWQKLKCMQKQRK